MAGLKSLLKKEDKHTSRQQDLERIRHIPGAEGLAHSHEATPCQPYLKAGLGRQAIQNVLRTRLLTLPIWDYRGHWKNASPRRRGCCLCQYHTESAEHIICCCPALLGPRRLYLRTVFLQNGVRTCKEALTCIYTTTVPMDLARIGKFYAEAGRTL